MSTISDGTVKTGNPLLLPSVGNDHSKPVSVMSVFNFSIASEVFNSASVIIPQLTFVALPIDTGENPTVK